MKTVIWAALLLPTLAQAATDEPGVSLSGLIDQLMSVVFYSIPLGASSIPVIVLWLIGGALFCTIRFGFLQFGSLGWPGAWCAGISTIPGPPEKSPIFRR
ncbi:hypothetical protein [Oceanimonas doudoroffii]|uniref:hypothetical protein n=1 Tax=Oceanimonas doudoroffii TaxID=84158 RepID=UPI001FE7215D|nr:hypothetical protein [Oceanimonas doudoroffii]